VNICKLSFFHLIIWVLFPYVHMTAQIFILNNLFVCLSFCDFSFFFIFLSISMVIISLELTRVNPDRNIFSINVELTSTFILYTGLVHHHHWILNLKKYKNIFYIFFTFFGFFSTLPIINQPTKVIDLIFFNELAYELAFQPYAYSLRPQPLYG